MPAAPFCELLPPTRTEPHGALTWEALSGEDSPLAGVLTITGRRAHCRYAVAEFGTAGGRGFQLAKDAGGSDPEATGYACFVAAAGSGLHSSCECRGWLRWGHCRHLAAIGALLENGQL